MTEGSQTLLYGKIIALAETSAPGLEKLFQIASKRQIEKGEVVLKQGQICNHIFFVEKGYLRTFIDKDGSEINTDFTFEGQFTTSLKSLRLSVPAENSIVAGEVTSIYEFEKSRLLGLYDESAAIESFGRKLLEQLLMAQEEHTNLFKIYSPAERYQYLLTNKPEILQRVSLSQLASYLGMARETLSRIRKK
jgi:CRP-like cAMP-binding protein